jgi:hypothetical protein
MVSHRLCLCSPVKGIRILGMAHQLISYPLLLCNNDNDDDDDVGDTQVDLKLNAGFQHWSGLVSSKGKLSL